MAKRTPDGSMKPRTAADRFYFELEAFLDEWRRHGLPEEVVRAALDRAKCFSIAMESVGKNLQFLSAQHLS